jgi:hypothetical protein
MVVLPHADPSEEMSVNVVTKVYERPSFSLSKYNSVVPVDLNEQHSNRSRDVVMQP